MITVVVGPFGFSMWTPKILQHMFWCPPQYYSNHLNTGLVWYLNDRIVSGCQMVLYLNGGLKTRLKKNPAYGQNVQYLNGSPSHVT